MRTIKFRFWEIIGKEMISWGDINKDHLHDYLSLDENIVIPLQFTGLHDKHGKEIYEGDVVRNWQGGWNVILYKAPSFEATVSSDQSCLYSIEWWNDLEIIGNIYENPDLVPGASA